MLDAVLIDDGSSPYNGAGDSILARTVGYGFQSTSGILAKYINNKWYKLSR